MKKEPHDEMESAKRDQQPLLKFGDLVEQTVRTGLGKIDDILHKDMLKKEDKNDREQRQILRKLDALLHKDIEKLLEKKGKDKDLARDPGPFRYLELLLKDRFVATFSPSSKFLIRRIVKAMDLKRTRVLVEYGPADGVVTKEILKHLPKDSLVVAIERNAEFHRRLSMIHDPRLKTVLGDVRDLERHLSRFGVEKADCIVSGIPFSYLEPHERETLLKVTADRLAPHGRFVAYQVTTHLIPLLKRYFRDIDIQFEIRNVPPHFVFTAFK